MSLARFIESATWDLMPKARAEYGFSNKIPSKHNTKTELRETSMKNQVVKSFVLATALTFCSGVLQLPIALATSVASEKVDLEITVKVNQKGFVDQRGKMFGGKNMLKIPKDTVVRITFVFDENLTSLAYGDTHQVAITGNDGWTKESQKIWMFNKQAQVTFRTGEEGSQYRAYCIIDCIEMEHLNNLVIRVV
jgi:hypothetical protein